MGLAGGSESRNTVAAKGNSYKGKAEKRRVLIVVCFSLYEESKSAAALGYRQGLQTRCAGMNRWQ